MWFDSRHDKLVVELIKIESLSTDIFETRTAAGS